MLRESIGIVRGAFTWAMHFFEKILEATGTRELVFAAVAFTVVFSVLVLPLRGGQAIRENSFAGFLTNRVNSHRGKGSNRSRRTDHDE